MRRTGSSLFRLVLLLGLLSLGTVAPSHAQTPLGEGDGTVTLEGWPRSLPTLLDEMGRDAPYLLPRIDSLALDYRYAATDTTSRWSFVLSWRPAERVLYEGEVLPLRDGPRGIRMTNVELRADVRVDGEKRAEMIVAVDSMGLRATPDRFAFNVTVGHERVFLDTPPDEARRILSEGATLDRLMVERMGFSSERGQRGDRSPDAGERRTEEPSRTPSIYTPRTRIYIGWRVAPRPYYVGDRDPGEERDRRPRGEEIGRTPTANGDQSRGEDRERGPEGRGSDEEDGAKGGTENEGEREARDDDENGEEEDEDDTDLRAPALAAAAAVGIVAFAGGTAGLYGRGDTPIGLASGYTHPRGGIQLQAAVNSAVLENDSDQKLSVRALGFYDVFESRVQPAVGLGVQVDPEEGRDVDPAVSGGLVGNFGRFVLYGGVDVVEGTPEVGLAYNFRYGRGEDESN
jgi:hypothetical protein